MRGGVPVGCFGDVGVELEGQAGGRVAEAVLDVVNTPEVLAGVKAKSAQFRQRLQAVGEKYGIFSEVRGLGLLLGCALTDAWKG